MATLRDAFIVLIGIEEEHRANSVIAFNRTKLQRLCPSWNLRFISINKFNIDRISYFIGRYDDLEVLHITNESDLSFNDVHMIGRQLVGKIPMHPRRPIVNFEWQCLYDMLRCPLEGAGIRTWKLPLHTAVETEYKNTHRQPQLTLVA